MLNGETKKSTSVASLFHRVMTLGIGKMIK